MKIGFIGQGYVGKNTANDFEARGFDIVRYSLEPEYIGNKEAIRECNIVFVAVPTPTTPEGFDFSIVEASLPLLKDGATVVLKSTLLPGTSKGLQERFPKLQVLFSPEFLCESTAAHDAANPIFNIIGTTSDSAEQEKAADTVMDILPKARNSFITTAEAAELFKYVHNIQGYMRVILSNLLYDTATKLGVDWEDVRRMMDVDPMMSPYYNSPLHKSGRGAGGHCFIKDMAAFRHLYADLLKDEKGVAILRALEVKNIELLKNSNKDLDLLRGVYGE